MGDLGTRPTIWEGVTLRQRILRGGVAVLVRSALVRGLSFAGTVALARLLPPQEFGVFVIVLFTVSFLNFLGDAGLAAALIQEAHEPTEAELRTVVTVQVTLAISVLGLGTVGLVLLGPSLHLGSQTTVIAAALGASFLLTVIKATPAALLERHLRYRPLAVVDSIQSLVFVAVAVISAAMHRGSTGFAAAAVSQAAVGAVLITRYQRPWYRLGVDRRCLRRLLGAGLTYQTQELLTLARNALTPLFVGAVAGTAAVGYVNWAYTVAATPLLFTYPLADVTFAAFARARHDPALVRLLLERSIRVVALAVFPLCLFTAVAGERLVDVVFGPHWRPALPALYLFVVSMATVPLASATSLSLLNALGKHRVALGIVATWAVLDWAVGAPLVVWLGFVGAAWRAVLVAALITPLLLVLVHRNVDARVLRQLGPPAVLAVAAGSVEWIVYRMTAPTPVSTIAGCALAGGTYVLLVIAAEHRLLRSVLTALWAPLPGAVRPPNSEGEVDEGGTRLPLFADGGVGSPR